MTSSFTPPEWEGIFAWIDSDCESEYTSSPSDVPLWIFATVADAERHYFGSTEDPKDYQDLLERDKFRAYVESELAYRDYLVSLMK